MKKDGNWVFRLNGRVHTFRIGGMLSVYVDDVLVHKKRIWLSFRELSRFQKNGHEFVVYITAGVRAELGLQVDGLEAERTNDRPLSAPNSPVGNAELVNTSVDSEVLKAEVGSEVITVPRGVKRTVKKSRTIARTVETDTTTKTGSDVGVIIGLLTAKVQSEIEKKLGRTFQESETVEQTVELDGNIHQRFQLTWYDRFRTGEISYQENGIVKNARFRFREGTELDVIEVK
jgi:hypothetical protein